MKTKIPAVPYLIWTLVFVLVPLFLVIYFAFTNQKGDFTLDNFANAASFTPVIVRSVILAAVSTLIILRFYICLCSFQYTYYNFHHLLS